MSDAFEEDIVASVRRHIGEELPCDLPEWLRREGIIPGAEILGAQGIGSQDRNNKTDVVIYLSGGSQPIKISVKLNNADYFGNWYGHKRFLTEFGREAFYRMTAASTKFANDWAKTAIAPYVGVSICFGRRTGGTAQSFTDVFTVDDILKVARGVGSGNSVANCMYIGSKSARTILELINSLIPITEETVTRATGSFMIAHRPINPMTEGTNRGKNVYTRFQPYRPLDKMTRITNPRQLFELGRFVEVEPNCINHNHILNDLRDNYNIYIPRKGE